MDASGEIVANQRFSHDRDGRERLRGFLNPSGESCPVREPYQVAPKKDDRFAALVLADTLRHQIGRRRAFAP